MNKMDSIMKSVEQRRLSRRNLIRGAVGAFTGASLYRPQPAFADDNKNDNNHDHADHLGSNLVNPIPGGVVPFRPFGVIVHHNPLNPAVSLPNISDPSQITDFDGFVGLTHIRGAGTGTNTVTGATTPLAYQADMGFVQGKFIGTDGHPHHGTLAFV